MGVTRHIRVTSEDIEDAALATVDYADDSITAAKVLDHTLGSQNLSTATNIIVGSAQLKDAVVLETKLVEHLEHGTITGVTVTGRYKTFGSAFGSAPDVVVTARGTYDARVVVTPAVGSFKAGLSAGTSNVMFHAWGARA